MLHNLTDSELVNLPTTTALEAELSKRLAENTLEEWEELQNRVEEHFTKAREANEFAEELRNALRKVATEIHRCAEFGEVQITPEFRKRCEEVVRAMDEAVAYEYPQGSLHKNNTSSFRAGGTA